MIQSDLEEETAAPRERHAAGSSRAEPHATAPSAQTSCGYVPAELILFLASEPSAPFLLFRRQNAAALRGNLSPTASYLSLSSRSFRKKKVSFLPAPFICIFHASMLSLGLKP